MGGEGVVVGAAGSRGELEVKASSEVFGIGTLWEKISEFILYWCLKCFVAE